MDRIPIMTQPFPDQLLFSYLMRIKEINLFDHRFFYESILQPEIVMYTRSLGNKYDYTRTLLPFTRLARIEDPVSFFLSTSLYLFLSAFIRPEERAKYLGYSLSNYGSDPFIWPKPKQSIKTLKLCPDCVEEDLRAFGTFYHHRSHQPYGVEVCYKHHKPLLAYHGDAENEFTLNLYEEIPQRQSLGFNRLYSRLAHVLLNPDEKERKDLLKELKENEDVDAFLEQVTNLAIKPLFRFQGEKKEKIKERIMGYLKRGYYEGEKAEENEGYEIVRRYQDNIYLCRCKKCGQVFVSSKPALDIGYTCSCKREGKTSEDIIWDLVGKDESKRFRLLYIPGFDYKSCLVMYDKASEKVLLIHPNAYLFNRFDRINNKPKEIKEGPYKPIALSDLEALPFRIYMDELDSLVVECKCCHYQESYSNKNTYISPCKLCGWDEDAKDKRQKIVLKRNWFGLGELHWC